MEGVECRDLLINGQRVAGTWDETPAGGSAVVAASLSISTIWCAAIALGIHRVMRLRQRLGISPYPFSEIPKRQRHHRRYYRVVARIVLEEAAFARSLARCNRRLATSKGAAQVVGHANRGHRISTFSRSLSTMPAGERSRFGPVERVTSRMRQQTTRHRRPPQLRHWPAARLMIRQRSRLLAQRPKGDA